MCVNVLSKNLFAQTTEKMVVDVFLDSFFGTILDDEIAQIVSVNCIGLTVSAETCLLLNVEKENSTNEHVLSGSLLSDGQGLAYRAVKVSANGTLIDTVLTDESGGFSLELNLQPENNSMTVYNFDFAFEGDDPSTVTGFMDTCNGSWAVCTTNYYGFKPTANSTQLIVTPQSTEVMQPTKTPKQIKQESQQGEWLSVYLED
jgi:hypothetical protein